MSPGSNDGSNGAPKLVGSFQLYLLSEPFV